MNAPRPARVSHLLAADDALIPGHWGTHTTMCGLEIHTPSATTAEHECYPTCDCLRYCSECVREAAS